MSITRNLEESLSDVQLCDGAELLAHSKGFRAEFGDTLVGTGVDYAHHTLAAMAAIGIGTLFAVEEDGLMLGRAVSLANEWTRSRRTLCLIGRVNVGKSLTTLAPTGWLRWENTLSEY